MQGPFVVGIGGSTRAGSVTDRLLESALLRCSALGARTALYSGDQLAKLPIYGTDENDAPTDLAALVAEADGLVVATPGYHGGISGLVKNGLDHLELLRDDRRPYLEGRPVGIIVTAAGWQACGTTLTSVRATVHALRGWPTPYGVIVNTTEPVFEGEDLVPSVSAALGILAGQVVGFGA